MPVFTTTQHLVPTHTFEDSPELGVPHHPRGHGLFRPRPTRNRASQPRPDRQIHQTALSEATIPDHSVHGRAGWEARDGVQGRIFGDEAVAARGPVGAFGPVGEYLDEFGRVCGHRSDEDVAREISVWMKYERHEDEDVAREVSVWTEYESRKDGDVDPFPAEELA
jgi:hypothetical protein